MNPQQVSNSKASNSSNTTAKHLCASENRYAEKLCDRICNEPLRDRVGNLLGWYIKRAKSNKRWFLFLSLLTILLPLSVGVINAFQIPSQSSKASTVISALGSLTSAIIMLFRFRDHWTQYRCCAEKIKSESVKYLIGTTPKYATQNKDEEFACEIERIALEENSNWSKDCNRISIPLSGTEPLNNPDL